MESAAAKTQIQELVQVRHLVKHFPVDNSDDVVQAVDDVSFDILSGETRQQPWLANPAAVNLPSDAVCCVYTNRRAARFF